MKTTEHSPDIVRQFFLEENPNPERIECPPEGTLQAAAENRLPLNDPARLHMADCSECFAEYRGYRLDWERNQAAKRRFIGWAMAASLLIGVVGGSFALQHHFGRNEAPQQIAINKPPNNNAGLPGVDLPVTPPTKQEDPHRLTRPEPRPPRHPLPETPPGTPPIGTRPVETPSPVPTPDNYGTSSVVLDLRPNPSKPRERKKTFTLPASNLKLKIILPSTAQTGVYTLRLTRDLDGQDVVASATGETVLADDVLSLDVKMLLRGKAAGVCHLYVGLKTDDERLIYDVRIVADQPPGRIR